MKLCTPFQVGLLALWTLCIAGCASANLGSGKDRGVYTTVTMEGQYLDLPASGYTSCKTFGPGQNPAAVVVGYGFWDGTYNTPQAFELVVVELATGTVICNQQGSSFAGKAAVINLPIRKNGNYRLKLLINGSIDDTWDFTVNRETTAGETTNSSQAQVYAQGVFGVSTEPLVADDAFSQYDSTLIGVILASVQRQEQKSPRETFAQVSPGTVAVRFNLDQTGKVSSAEVVGNTLTEPLAQFFLRALQQGAPYPAWPAALRAARSTGTRAMKVTFHYD